MPKKTSRKKRPAPKPKAKPKQKQRRPPAKKKELRDKLQESLIAKQLGQIGQSEGDREAEPTTGRPTLYTPELAALICVEISTCSDGLEIICERNSDFPSARTIYRWLNEHEEFRQAYARAKRQQVSPLIERVMSIAQTPKIGEIVTVKADGVEVKRVDMVEHRKLEIDTYKWMVAHLEPKKWGRNPDDSSDDSRLDELIEAIRESRKKKA